MFFGPQAKLNDEAIAEYKLDARDGEEGSNLKSQQGDLDFAERFDGRGRKIRVKLAKYQNPALQRIGFSCAVVDLQP